MSDQLTAMQWKFVLRYCEMLGVDGEKPNATEAALFAGVTESSAHSLASQWLKLDKIKTAVERRKAELAEAAGVTPEFVLREWMEIAQADPGELSQLRKTCCRYCWGFNHRYQWTEGGYETALDRAIEAKKPAPDGTGGFNFDMNRDPHPDCPECGGLGVEREFFADTRKLSKRGRKLYAGIQRTNNGLKVLTRDQDAALTNLAKYLGMLVDRREISGPGGSPMRYTDAKSLTDDELAALARGSNDGGNGDTTSGSA